MELDAIAAAVIGGTSLLGGIGSIEGAIVGALLMASISNGMSLLNILTWWQQIVTGLLLMGAVLVDINSKRRSGNQAQLEVERGGRRTHRAALGTLRQISFSATAGLCSSIPARSSEATWPSGEIGSLPPAR